MLNTVCRECDLKLKRKDCSELEFKECYNNKYNIYTLYLKDKDGKEKFYGSGPKEYMIELVNDYIVINNLYNKESMTFTVKRGLLER